MKKLITEAYINGAYNFPHEGMYRSQAHTGPEYRYPDEKFKTFLKTRRESWAVTNKPMVKVVWSKNSKPT